jgi:hypothetical protein
MHGMVESEIGLTLFQVTGTVANTGNDSAQSVYAIATFYNTAGNVIDFDAILTSSSAIPPGHSANLAMVTLVGDYGN